MKKTFKIIIPIIVLGLLAYMGYVVFQKISHKKQVAEQIQQMPDFAYQTLAGENFTQNNLKTNTPVLFIYFNSECDFCHHEAQMVYDNMQALKPIEVVFISFEPKENIKNFATQHNLLNYDNIYFISDSKATFATTFDVRTMPCLVLYDQNKNLIEKIKGQIKIEAVLQKFKTAS